MIYVKTTICFIVKIAFYPIHVMYPEFSCVVSCLVRYPAFRIQDSGFRIQDSGFRIQDSGFRISKIVIATTPIASDPE